MVRVDFVGLPALMLTLHAFRMQIMDQLLDIPCEGPPVNRQYITIFKRRW